MPRHGHISELGWHWWWMSERTALVHTSQHQLLLCDAASLPFILGPTYADRETYTP